MHAHVHACTLTQTHPHARKYACMYARTPMEPNTLSTYQLNIYYTAYLQYKNRNSNRWYPINV